MQVHVVGFDHLHGKSYVAVPEWIHRSWNFPESPEETEMRVLLKEDPENLETDNPPRVVLSVTKAIRSTSRKAVWFNEVTEVQRPKTSLRGKREAADQFTHPKNVATVYMQKKRPAQSNLNASLYSLARDWQQNLVSERCFSANAGLGVWKKYSVGPIEP
jgi:hypothetical protein